MVQFHNNEAGEESRPGTARASHPLPSSPSPRTRKVCFSFAAYARSVIDHLKRCQVPIAKGLSDHEFAAIEASFGFVFPPDLRSVLSEGMPVGVGFPNWRSSSSALQMMVDLPMATLSYEIAKGTFWCKNWPPRPSTSLEALRIARNQLSKVPTLIPIYTHCYIPCSPCLAGNPVFLLYQTNFYLCGFDISDFFQREPFLPNSSSSNSASLCRIRDLIDPARVPCKFHENGSSSGTPRPTKAVTLSRLTIRGVPSWVAAKTAREIHFWSDLVDKKQSSIDAAPPASQHGVFSSTLFDLSIKSGNGGCRKVRWQDMAVTEMKNRTWISRYLNDMQCRLRSGGWKEHDIFDILNSSSAPPSQLSKAQTLDREIFVKNLSLRFDKLSAALRKGGWSAADVVECFGSDDGHHFPAAYANFQAAN